MMKRSLSYRYTAILLAAAAASGCGLKGALTLPSKSEEVVIRASDQAAPAQAEATSVPSATAPTAPAKEKPAKPKDERIPPPPLPGDNQGTARGG